MPDDFVAKTLHRWHDAAGNEWACAAYDHGPMCRLCQQVDDSILRALLDHADNGFLLVRATNTGEFEFKMTPNGEDKVQDILAQDPSLLNLYTDLVPPKREV